MTRVDERRSKPFPIQSSLTAHYEAFLARLGDLRTTRRSLLLGVAGVSAGLPMAGALARAASRFSVDTTSTRLNVQVGGRSAWRVDTTWFDGRPRLNVKHSDGYLRVQLRDALFPASKLPADFTLVTKRAGVDWTARLSFPAIDFDAEFPFDQWLLGLERAKAPASISDLAFRQPTEFHFDHLTGQASFGPDWILDLNGLSGCGLRVGKQRVELTALRLELPSARASDQQATDQRCLEIWPTMGTGRALRFVAGEKSLLLTPEQAHAYIAASPESVLMMMEGGAEHAKLLWKVAGLRELELPTRAARINMHYTGGRAELSGRAVVSGYNWHHDDKLSVELALAESESDIALSNQEAAAAVPAPLPIPHRFVVSLPGCDAAMFSRPAEPTPQLPVALGATLFDLGKHNIALDQYELVLKRAADALALTVRFRNVHLVFTWRGWQLVSDADAGSLIEFDFGPQHLQEEAVYIDNWPCASVEPAGCTQAFPSKIPVSDELAALAVLELGVTSDDKKYSYSPLSKADLATNNLRDSKALVKHMYATDARAKDFRAFRSNAELRTLLAGLGTGTADKCANIERSRATHLTFDFDAPGGMMFTVDNLLAWASADMPGGSHNAMKGTYRARLSARAAAATERCFVPFDKHDDPDHPRIMRPMSLIHRNASIADYATAIEVPARLVMSPVAGATSKWSGISNQALAGRSELWSVRLTGAQIRAVYAHDARRYDAPASCITAPECDTGSGNPDQYQVDIFNPPRPFKRDAAKCDFRTSLDARDRHEILIQSSFNGFKALCGSAQVACTPEPEKDDQGRHVSVPIEAAYLQLSSLGASFKYKARWDPPAGPSGALSVTRYDHHGQLGRDIVVRVEYKGFLFPIGHPAILVKLTERRFCFEKAAAGKFQLVARLVQRFFIHVPAFTRAMPAVGQPNEHRLWGHAALHMDEVSTGDLSDPTCENSSFAGLGQSAFWPRNLARSLIEFEFGEPGTHTLYAAPLLFVDNNVAHSSDMLKTVIDKWREQTHGLLQLPSAKWLSPDQDLRGFARVRSARLPYVVGLRGDNTDIETDAVILDVQNRLDEQANIAGSAACAYRYAPYDDRDWGVTARMEAQKQPPFYPVRRRCRIKLSKLAMLSGLPGQTYLIEFDPVFAACGFNPGQNGGQIYARLVGEPAMLNFSGNTSKSGGFANPSTAIVYLSAKRGPLGGNRADLIALTVSGTLADNTKIFGAELKPAPVLVSLQSPQTTSQLTIANAHAENMVPAEFFSAFIGDAKILGVVRIADIVRSALSAAGSAIPTINTDALFDFAEDALRPVVKVARDTLDNVSNDLSKSVPAAVQARLAPRMQEVGELLHALDLLLGNRPVDGARLLVQANAFARALTNLAQTVDGLAHEPTVLLPPDIQSVVDTLTNILDAMRNPNFQHVLRKSLKLAVEAFVDAQLVSGLAELRKAIVGSPEMQTLREMIDALRGKVESIKQLLDQVRNDLAAALDDALVELFGMVRDMAALVALLNDSVAEAVVLRAKLQTAAGELVAGYGDIKHSALDAVYMRITGFQSAVNKCLTAAEAALAAPVLSETARALAAPHMASARRASIALADAMQDQVWRIRVLLNPALEVPEPPQDAPHALLKLDDELASSLRRIQYVAAVPATMVRQVQKLTEMLQALTDCASQLATVSAAAPGQWCDDAVKEIVTAFQAYLAASFADTNPEINFKTALARLGGCAASLSAPHQGHEPISDSEKYVQELAGRLASAVSAVQTFPDRLLAGAVAPMFDIANVCHANPSAICAEAKKRLAEVSGTLDTVRRAGDAIVQVLVYTAGVEPAVKSRLLECSAQFKQAQKRACTALQDLKKAWPKVAEPVVLAINALLATPVGADQVGAYLGRELKAAILALKAALDANEPRWSTLDRNIRGLYDLLGQALSINGVGQLIDINKALNDLVGTLGVPNRVRVSYDWNTEIHSFPEGSGAIFEPEAYGRLTIQALIESGLRGGPSTTMSASVSAFKINLFGKGAGRFLTVSMAPLSLKLRPGLPLVCKTKVLAVVPGEALGFVNNLATLLDLDTSFIILPTFNGIRVGYEFSAEFKPLGGFIAQNILFAISADLPFDNSPVRISVRLSDKLKPFLISAGIYGGGGFFQVRSRADTIEVLEASFEYGVVTGFSFGPLRGSGRITAGIYIRLGGRDAAIEGFFCAIGEVSLAGLFHCGASLRVALTYNIAQGKISGMAKYEFHFSIGWFKYSYRISVNYERAGDSHAQPKRAMIEDVAPTLAQTSQPQYADAFSPAAWQALWPASESPTTPAHLATSSCTPFAAYA